MLLHTFMEKIRPVPNSRALTHTFTHWIHTEHTPVPSQQALWRHAGDPMPFMGELLTSCPQALFFTASKDYSTEEGERGRGSRREGEREFEMKMRMDVENY